MLRRAGPPIALALLAAVASTACTSFKVAADDTSEGADAGNWISGMSQPEIEIPDNDAAGITDTIDIGTACRIDAVEVDIDIVHPWRGDVTANLTSPAQTIVILKDYADEDGVDDIVGTYPTTLIPVQSLSAFRDEEGQGTWTLQASDLDVDDTGTLESWGLRLACR